MAVHCRTVNGFFRGFGYPGINELALVNDNHICCSKTIQAPPTVRYIPNFITGEEEESLLTQIYGAPKPKWQNLLNRRLQNWGGIVGKKALVPDGNIPQWLTYVIDKLMSLGDSFPPENRPNHVLVNEYIPGQGIMAHTDGPAFYPMVATISLGGDILLDYYKPLDPKKKKTVEERYMGSMLLQRRSLILFSDEAYTKCLHEIADRRIGEVVNRSLRVSLTIRNVRKVCKMSTADLIAKR
ncbi:unnamed protein product [Gongylonema pulchrum]|uniref:Fe2OG dioxygenase domain-containing protein n=1 Tax=Gongylonema pulchrum TaxID=637853 RepID=A0A3P6PNX9_9BILA|nr:unnamed protein product [Gongylonema pulchrum]